MPLIKVSKIDPNADGKMDALNLHIELRSLPGRGASISKSIRNVKILGTVDYTLQDMLQMEMIGLF